MQPSTQPVCDRVLDDPCLSKQLIAYIGNKRRLLPLIKRALMLCAEPDMAAPGAAPRNEADAPPVFVDFFAGSGAVARLAKLLGYHVVANDWEEYAWVLNEAFVVTQQRDLETLFADKGGIARVLAELNALDTGREGVISRYYAPKATEGADPDRERLFYTSENARRIDAIRAWIEREYPGEILDERRSREKHLLVGLLLYEAATHANTSGVFKGFHRGFGGRAGDALDRILKPVELEFPALCDGSAEAYREDAEALAGRLARRSARTGQEIRVAYLDPPYNQHQYGSNYHILNTIARYDTPQISERPRTGKRGKEDKSGIRRDWVKTRSPFCKKAAAGIAFERLTQKIRARHILVSYSTEGTIPFEEMAAILGRCGRLEVALAEYTRYRGGKQALTTTNTNVEFVLIAHTALPNTEEDTRLVLRAIHTARLAVYLKRAVSPARLIARDYHLAPSACLDEGLEWGKELSFGLSIRLSVKNFKHIESCAICKEGKALALEDMGAPEFDAALKEIAELSAITREEELEVTLCRARYLLEKGNLHSLGGPLVEIPLLLRKFNESRDYPASLARLEQALSFAADIAGEMSRRAYPPALAKKYSAFVRGLGFLVRRKASVLPKKNDPELMELCARLDARSNRLAIAHRT